MRRVDLSAAGPVPAPRLLPARRPAPRAPRRTTPGAGGRSRSISSTPREAASRRRSRWPARGSKVPRGPQRDGPRSAGAVRCRPARRSPSPPPSHPPAPRWPSASASTTARSPAGPCPSRSLPTVTRSTSSSHHRRRCRPPRSPTSRPRSTTPWCTATSRASRPPCTSNDADLVPRAGALRLTLDGTLRVQPPGTVWRFDFTYTVDLRVLPDTGPDPTRVLGVATTGRGRLRLTLARPPAGRRRRHPRQRQVQGRADLAVADREPGVDDGGQTRCGSPRSPGGPIRASA